ncbi:hypothetical protein J2T57_001378 [Natronocella acetinitrilica]|uniref:Uncharacterized protein n=1 Tax=Natronocella acetinitrilica TaxID=414046 RepID=A0AAE3G3W4_9GAMM|nr:hypothetical protein [Natronocella acetinitrilica]MCP1674276.1 hypothetical protein [Natronocella acetinitrilica]
MNQVGVCLFDDPRTATGGWASVAGREAERVSGTGRLSSDVLWVTNLGYRDYQRLNLIRTPHIFDEQYFRTSIKAMCSELGLEGDPARAACHLSTILDRVAQSGAEILGVNIAQPGYRYSSLVSTALHLPSMRQQPHGAHASEIRAALTQATQSNQAMAGVQRPYGASCKGFNYPRGALAKWLLSQPYPISNDWKELKQASGQTVFGVEDGQLIRGTKAVRQTLSELGEKAAVFLRVRVLDTDTFYRPFATFGAGANAPRGWAALPEVLYLSKFCKLSVSGGFRCSAGRLELPPGVDLANAEYSYSRALMLENLWVGLATPLQGAGQPTAVGAYMRAYDRVVCGKAAEQFARNSFVVGSYGTGRVMVYVRKGEEAAAARISLDAGLSPPMDIAQLASGGQ